MRKILLFNGFITMILLALFIWQTIYAALKWLEFTTITSSSSEDEGSVLFPSITVCKNYLNGLRPEVVTNASLDTKDKIEILHQKTWKKNEVFYFFSHAKMFNKTFPCTTKEGATEQGKPCSFPFIDEVHGKQEKCVDPLIFCYTRSAWAYRPRVGLRRKKFYHWFSIVKYIFTSSHRHLQKIYLKGM